MLVFRLLSHLVLSCLSHLVSSCHVCLVLSCLNLSRLVLSRLVSSCLIFLLLYCLVFFLVSSFLRLGVLKSHLSYLFPSCLKCLINLCLYLTTSVICKTLKNTNDKLFKSYDSHKRLQFNVQPL